MPKLQDKLSEPPFPSELNPLTNPVLERHLGRWAQVYFGTPPAKRQQAVGKLLEEIQRETGAGATEEAVRPNFVRDEKFQSELCAACRHQNPPGHKFCSRCGQALHLAQPDPPRSISENEVREVPPSGPGNEVQWLRDRAFGGLDGSEGPQRRGWKYLVGAFVLVLAGLAYLQWAPRPRTGMSSTAGAPQLSAPPASSPQNSSPAESNPTETTSPESKTAEAQHAGIPEAHDQAAMPSGVQPASQKSPLLNVQSSRPAPVVDAGGDSELRLAQRYLGGSMGVRDSSEAAKLLWKSVGKQNATAALLLSGLYLRGDGVPRSCDQARLLLVAAARRGAPQAAQQLRDLESQGCR